MTHRRRALDGATPQQLLIDEPFEHRKVAAAAAERCLCPDGEPCRVHNTPDWRDSEPEPVECVECGGEETWCGHDRTCSKGGDL